MIDAKALLRELIGIDTTSARSNLPLLEVLEPQLRALGFSLRRQEWKDAAGVAKANLIAQRGEGPDGLALVGHSDCVPFDPAWPEALAPREADGKLYGRGSADTKAFLACALAAAARAGQGDRPLMVIATADEEVGCLGAKRLLDDPKRPAPAHAIVGEPTQLAPVRAHKGYCLAEITIDGVEGHSAYPETGASAIFAAGRLLTALEAIQEQLRADQDPLFAPPWTTLNAGLIAGGKAKNIIPGRCTITLEWRPLPNQDVRKVLQAVEQACARHSQGGIRASVKASRLDVGVRVPEEAALVQFLAAQCGKAPATIPFGTELPQLTALGASACVFGPGDIRVAHRTGEFVPLDELSACQVALTAAIERFTDSEESPTSR